MLSCPDSDSDIAVEQGLSTVRIAPALIRVLSMWSFLNFCSNAPPNGPVANGSGKPNANKKHRHGTQSAAALERLAKAGSPYLCFCNSRDQRIAGVFFHSEDRFQYCCAVETILKACQVQARGIVQFNNKFGFFSKYCNAKCNGKDDPMFQLNTK